MLSERLFKQQEPAISYSLINMKLRNQFDSWLALVRYYELPDDYMKQFLSKNNWRYDEQQNQLKQIR